MKTQRLAVVAAIAVMTGCMDDGRLPTDPPAAQFYSQSGSTFSVSCSAGDLIAAIDAANQLPSATLNLASACVYELTNPNNISPNTGINGLPVIRTTLTINGNNATIEREPGSDFRLFFVLNTEDPAQPEQGAGNLTMSNVTLRGGSYSNSGGALNNFGGTVVLTNVIIENSHSGDDGGGVFNHLGTLTITNGVIRGNTASDHGGGVSNNFGTLTLRNTRVEDNIVSDNGGGVSNYFGTLIVADNSIIQRNDAGDSGGLYNEGGTVVIAGSRIENNVANDHGGGLQNVGTGTVTISNSVISGNHASDSGGGLSNHGFEMNVFNSTITSNHASDSGAGIANRLGGILNVSFSTISSNVADEDGGGIFNSGGGVTMTSSTLSGNTAKFGGGLSSESGDDLLDNLINTDFGLVNLTNTTISGNKASEGGGGIYADKGTNLQVTFSTITKNTAATKGGGGALLYNDLDAATRFKGTIISENSANDVQGVERKSLVCCSLGNNLIGRAGAYIDLNADFPFATDLKNVTNPRLGSLGNNGGPTKTHALKTSSPASLAINAGGSSGPATDQRGATRGSTLDIGAFEIVSSATFATAQTITFAAPPSSLPLGTNFQVSATASSGLPVTLAATGACSTSAATTPFGVTMTAASGACVLTATQNGNGSFAPAAPVVRVIAATKAAQTIVFTTTPVSPTSGQTYTPAANGGGSPNPIVFGATGSCSASNGVITLAAGQCTVSADQGGDADHFAGHAEQTFTVAAASGIAFQSQSNAQNGDATTLRINRPAGTGAGDFLLAQITSDKGGDVGITPPPGWELVRRTNNSSDVGQAIYRRVATASEPASYEWTFSQSVKAAGGILRYTGVSASSPIVASSGSTGVSSSLTASSITAANNGMLVALYAFKKKEITLTAPTGMSGRYNFENPNDITIGANDERKSVWATTTGNRTSSAVQPGATSPVTEKFVAQLVMLRAN